MGFEVRLQEWVQQAKFQDGNMWILHHREVKDLRVA